MRQGRRSDWEKRGVGGLCASNESWHLDSEKGVDCCDDHGDEGGVEDLTGCEAGVRKAPEDGANLLALLNSLNPPPFSSYTPNERSEGWNPSEEERKSDRATGRNRNGQRKNKRR